MWRNLFLVIVQSAIESKKMASLELKKKKHCHTDILSVSNTKLEKDRFNGKLYNI